MSWLSSWFRGWLKKGINISYSGNWPDDKGLPNFTGHNDHKTKEEIMRELAAKNKEHKHESA